MAEPVEGTVSHTLDTGAETHVVVRTMDGGQRSFEVDSAWLRRLLAHLGKPSLASLHIEFKPDEAGGIVWMSVIPPGYRRCLTCGGQVAPHLNPLRCFDGFHIPKDLPFELGGR